MKTPKTFRLGFMAELDLKKICESLKINQTEAVEWALRVAVQEAERIEIETKPKQNLVPMPGAEKLQELKAEYLHDKSPD